MAEVIYGKGIERAVDKLRKSLYKEVGNLLQAQTKGAIIPENISVTLTIPLIPE
jgi:hypothetical protein